MHEIVLARIMTSLDLEFKRSLHYHDEGYESDNDYELPGQVMKPVHVYSVSTTDVSFSPQTTREYNVPSLPSQQGDLGTSCLSINESANA